MPDPTPPAGWDPRNIVNQTPPLVGNLQALADSLRVATVDRTHAAVIGTVESAGSGSFVVRQTLFGIAPDPSAAPLFLRTHSPFAGNTVHVQYGPGTIIDSAKGASVISAGTAVVVGGVTSSDALQAQMIIPIANAQTPTSLRGAFGHARHGIPIHELASAGRFKTARSARPLDVITTTTAPIQFSDAFGYPISSIIAPKLIVANIPGSFCYNVQVQSQIVLSPAMDTAFRINLKADNSALLNEAGEVDISAAAEQPSKPNFTAGFGILFGFDVSIYSTCPNMPGPFSVPGVSVGYGFNSQGIIPAPLDGPGAKTAVPATACIKVVVVLLPEGVVVLLPLPVRINPFGVNVCPALTLEGGDLASSVYVSGSAPPGPFSIDLTKDQTGTIGVTPVQPSFVVVLSDPHYNLGLSLGFSLDLMFLNQKVKSYPRLSLPAAALHFAAAPQPLELPFQTHGELSVVPSYLIFNHANETESVSVTQVGYTGTFSANLPQCDFFKLNNNSAVGPGPVSFSVTSFRTAGQSGRACILNIVGAPGSPVVSVDLDFYKQ